MKHYNQVPIFENGGKPSCYSVPSDRCKYLEAGPVENYINKLDVWWRKHCAMAGHLWEIWIQQMFTEQEKYFCAKSNLWCLSESVWHSLICYQGWSPCSQKVW